MVRCVDCGEEVLEERCVYRDTCGSPLCEGVGASGLCSACAELSARAEIDLEDTEEE